MPLEVRVLIRKARKSTSNRANLHQLARSSESVRANYVEANKALTKKGFVTRVRVCPKYAKESGDWLQLLDRSGQTRNLKAKRLPLIWESPSETMS